MALKREEAKIIRDIKAAAKQGNQPAMKILAKSLVRLRGQVTKLQSSSAQLQGVGMTMTVSPLENSGWEHGHDLAPWAPSYDITAQRIKAQPLKHSAAQHCTALHHGGD